MGCDPYRKYLNHRPKRMVEKVEAKDLGPRELGTLGAHLDEEEPPLTAKERVLLLNTIFAAWEHNPNQRLGQLLVNALAAARAGSLYQVSDRYLIEVVRDFTDKLRRAEATLAAK